MIKKLPKSKIEFEITVVWKDWEKYLDQAAAELSSEIKIPGFRPGKAPRSIVEKRIGKSVVLNEAAEKAVRKSYRDFVLKEKLEVIGSPKIEVKKLEEGEDLEYKAEAAVMPEITVKGEHKKGIKKINEEFSKKTFETNEDDLKLELEKLAGSRVKLVTVRRETKDGDSVEIDFEVLVGGVPIENGKSKNHPLIIGRGVFIPGFEDQIVGMKEGEEKEFELSFPEDYHKKDLAGKVAVFKVKMNLVQERQIPEVDDDFAKSLGNFENLEALKKNIREGMEHESKHKAQDERRVKYIDKIIENSEVDLPEILIQEETEKMMHEFEHQIQSMGMNLDDYLLKLKKDKKELEKDWEDQARKRVISALAISQIARDEEIMVDSKEVEAEMNKTLAYYKKVKDAEKNIDMERLYSYSKGILENEKVFEMLEKMK
ncbi:MAG: Trigger factor [Patescibacteria group bacterium]|nr:Trigger factor [Patescibacteria group bacterium]